MVGGSPMEAVFLAPGVKGKDVACLRRDAKDGVDGLIHSIIARQPGKEESFYVLDLGAVVQLFGAWSRALRDVRPYYAVKCNPETALLGALAALGAGFDCASRAEIEAVLALGVSADRVVYANPCKAVSHIKYAAGAGVRLTTFDSTEEVGKLKKHHPGCKLLLRLKSDDAHGRCPMGSKYGALPEEVAPLLRAARDAGITVAGVSFHVGSPVARAESFLDAIAAARAVFDAARQLGMPDLRILDIGGGMVAGECFEAVAAAVKSGLAEHFAGVPQLEVIGEPGRYFSEAPFTLATCVIGKRTRGEVREYWINDGRYGSFNCIIHDKAVVVPRPLSCGGGDRSPSCCGRETHPSTVFGPTCDSQDTVVRAHQLPELHVGDWLVWPNMGAYTTSSWTNFNGFATSAVGTHLAYTTPY